LSETMMRAWSGSRWAVTEMFPLGPAASMALRQRFKMEMRIPAES